MLHKTKDDALINSAYLSELWAVQDLSRMKKLHWDLWSPERETQLQDEVRHANMLLNVLKKKQAVVVKDLAYSMQERLYAHVVRLNSTHNMSEASLVHNMTERRAVWIYKTYQKVGQDPDYKEVVAEIYQDEKNHFAVNDHDIGSASLNHFLAENVKRADRFLFRKYLPEKFGSIIFNSEDFWNYYYQEATV